MTGLNHSKCLNILIEITNFTFRKEAMMIITTNFTEFDVCVWGGAQPVSNGQSLPPPTAWLMWPNGMICSILMTSQALGTSLPLPPTNQPLRLPDTPPTEHCSKNIFGQSLNWYWIEITMTFSIYFQVSLLEALIIFKFYLNMDLNLNNKVQW